MKKQSSQITGSEAILQSMIEEGVDTIFGYPGGAIMPFYDALYGYSDKIRHILVRHEQGAAHAAEGYAYATGRPGICVATSGPGATNLVTGIMDAMMDSVPMVCITGQVAASVVGTDAFQEADVIGITTPITKWNYQVTSASEIPEVMAKAFHIARTGRPGPVLVDITKNAQFELCDFVYKKIERIDSFEPVTEPDSEQIEKAAALLNAAKKPYMFVGHGVMLAGAYDEVRKLSEKAGIPVASTLLGLSAMSVDHPNYVGMLGMHGNYAPNILTNKADVILAVGMRFDDRVTGKVDTYAKQATIIHIDVDPAELNKIVKTEVPIVADAKKGLQALLPHVKTQKHDSWLQEFADLKSKEKSVVMNEEVYPEKGEIKMAEVIRMLGEKTDENSIIVADVGQHQMMAARYFNFRAPHTWITSGGSGTMGFSLPASVGAKIAAPEKQVISISGDGSFQMNIQELGTIMQEKLPVKIVILNNHFLGMVRQWQQLFFEKRYSFTDIKSPDFVAVAQAYGIDGSRVSVRGELDKALNDMLNSEGPYLLEINVEKEQNVFPMVPTGAGVDEVRLS
jgi:acetolactate synthase-1/2/3 large subunit